MKYDLFEHSCYNLYTIKTDRFNTNRIEIVFKLKCTKENLTYTALLFDVLTESNSKYKTRKELSRALEDLYDADMYSSVTRVGGMIIASIIIEIVNFKSDKDLTRKAVDILFSCIFNPHLINGKFSYKVVEKMKRSMTNDIKSIKEDTKQSSILEALKCLNEDSPRCFSISGALDVLENVREDSLYEFYRTLLNEADKEIYVVGDIDPKKIDDYIYESIKFNSITEKNNNVYLDEIKTKRIKKSVLSDDMQANYVEVYSLNGLTFFEREYVVTVFNAIWGSGSLESRLYKALRGKKGLCYNVNAYYQKYDRCLIVHTAVEPQNVDEVSKIINKTLTEMIKTDVTDRELLSSKMMITNSLMLIKDSPKKLVDNYLFKNMNLIEDEYKRKECFNKVSKADIKKMAKKIKLAVTYSVGGNR